MLHDQDRLRFIPGNLSATNLKDVIEQRCQLQPERLAFNFLRDGELDQQEPLSYGELDAYARSILLALRAHSKQGDRALLLFPPGNAFMTAFVACLYGGVVAVPVAIAGARPRDWARVAAIIEDCQPSVILSCGEHVGQVETQLKSALPSWRGCVIDVGLLPAAPSAAVATSQVAGDDLAFLQYTSGSTGDPKGVMVTHDSLFYNQRLIQTAYDLDQDSRLVTWLPMFHDMGLIGSGLHVLYLGVPLYYMAPEAFLQRPLRWMQAISHFRGTSSGGPNFAYELCLARYRPEDCEGLDLSTWRRAFNGAEPVRAATLERFQRTFARYGLAATALYPTYGLAEAVLLVSGGMGYAPPTVRRVRSDHYFRGAITPASAEHASTVLVGVGEVLGSQHALIVDPQTLEPVGTNQIGEIWLSGPSVAGGYWRNEEASRAVFRARPAGASDGPEYLRTGDLGTLDEHGQLYITGRIKDTIIIGGKNYYPQDLEYAVETVDKALRPGGTAIFGVEHDSQERIVVLQELRAEDAQGLDTAALMKAIRAKIASEFQLSVFDVCLVKPRSVLKTTSGKVQRRRNKQAYLAGELKLVAQHRRAERASNATVPSSHAVFQLVLDWVKTIPDAPARIATDDLFVDIGMDSARAVNLAEYLSGRLGDRVDVTSLWSYPEIGRFCEVLSEKLAGRDTAVPEPRPANEVKTNVHELSEQEFQALLAKELS
jgi:acyl-CoA synthetase (AMP-forming)/AMP-acid ligase II